MLKIVICCDVDPDVSRYDMPAARFDIYKENLTWKGVERGIPKAREICDLVKDSRANNAKVTWFVRSDEQLKTILDDYAYPLRNFWNLWKKLQQRGDEIGWHPHLWRWSDQKKCWHQEVSDEKWMGQCLERAHAEFLRLVKNLTSTRSGWGYQNNFTMRKLENLGLQVDLSALPGLKHRGCCDERGSHFVNEYDWSITKEHPYFPSAKDYRRPKKRNEETLRILEIPVTTSSKGFSQIFIGKGLRLLPLSFTKAMLRDQTYTLGDFRHRHIAHTTSPYFRHLVKLRFKTATKNDSTFVSVFHVEELSSQKSLLNLKNNLKVMEDLSRRLRVPLVFLTATEMANEFLRNSPACAHILKDIF